MNNVLSVVDRLNIVEERIREHEKNVNRNFKTSSGTTYKNINQTKNNRTGCLRPVDQLQEFL